MLCHNIWPGAMIPGLIQPLPIADIVITETLGQSPLTSLKLFVKLALDVNGAHALKRIHE